jgi:hypothetical protein
MRCKHMVPALLTVVGLAAFSAQPAVAYTLLQVIPIIQLNQLYDDNIQLSASHPEGDFVTNLVGGVNLTYYGAKRTGSFQYETVGENFLKYSQYDNIGSTHFLQFYDRERMSERTTLSIDDWFLAGKIPSSLFTSGSVAKSIPSLNPQVALAILGRVRSISNFAEVILTHRFDERWSVAVGAKHDMLYTAAATTLLANFYGQAEYALTPRTGVNAGYNYYNFSFSNGSPPLQTHYSRLGLSWGGSKQFQFHGSIGAMMFQNSGDLGNWFEPGYSATAAYQSSVWRIIVSGGQEPGITGSGGAGTIRTASSDVAYVLRRNVTLFAGMSYYRLQSGHSSSEMISYGGGLSYHFKAGINFYSQYLGIIESAGAADFLQTVPPGTNGSGTVRNNSYMFGMSLTFEAFRKAL